jgi:hypothetical protein
LTAINLTNKTALYYRGYFSWYLQRKIDRQFAAGE